MHFRCHQLGARVSGVLALVFALLAAAPGSVGAQEPVLAERGPRFLVAPTPSAAPVPLDLRRAPVLRREIALQLSGATMSDALEAITEATGLAFVYGLDLLPAGTRVNLRAEQITVAAALTQVLIDTDLDVLLLPSGRQVALVKRGAGALPAGAIVGRVTDAKTGEGLVGAEVVLEGAQRRGMTGPDGRYRLADVAPGQYTLAVRRIGYARQSRPVTVLEGQEVTVDVALEAVPTQLNEIVTTVTGDQRRVELGHVVGRINADSLVKEAPVSSLSELLNGRVPGLQVFQGQGTVGGEVRLQIRGANTMLLSTEPIVIVDGVRYTTAASGATPLFGSEPTSRLNDLNPNDIETIEVIKGPSAATLYGTDAANGVLVITTKRGKPGPARWNAYGKGTMTEIPTQHYPDHYWGWGTVDGIPNNPTFSCTLGRVAAGSCTKQDSVTVLPNPLNDPDLTLFGSKPQWEYGANVAGGRQDLRYYFSGDFADATGPVQMPPAIARQLEQQRGLGELPDEWQEPNTLAKLNLRANVTAVLGDDADLRVNAGYIRNATRSVAAAGPGSPYSAAVFSGAPNRPYSTDLGVDPAESFAQTSTERADRFAASASGQWRPASWLATRATLGLDLTNSNRYSIVRRGDAPNHFAFLNGAVVSFSSGAVGDERIRQVATTAEVGATATLRRGRLSARTAVGAQYVRNLNDALQSLGTDLPPGGSSVGEAANVQSRQTYAETVTLGSYLEETFGLNERLFLTGALRVDGAKAFGRDYDATVYPKVSASWLLSEEPFIPQVPGLDELRLRYAYGASGQQPQPAWALPRYIPLRSVENGAATPAVQLVGLGNPLLRPERVREHEFGFDATALASRLRLGLTWYRRRAMDQIAFVQLPSGLGIISTNLGLTTQHGFEAELTAQVFDSRLLSWDLALQHSVHRTRLVDLGTGFVLPSRDGGWKPGYPLGGRFQQPIAGYADANGDGILAYDEVQIGDTAAYMGESAPPRSQALTTVLGFFDRRLRVSTLLERRTGFTQVNALRQTQCYAGTCRAAVDPSMPLAEQAEAVYAAIGFGVPEPGDFIRWREIAAAVDLPSSVARALRVRSATLALSARNLALWTDFSGPDPESAAPVIGNSAAGGVAAGIPQGRSWTLRLDLGL